MKNNRIWGLWGLLLVCCLAAVLWPGRVEAATIVESGYCGGEGDGSNLTWTLDDEGTLTISGSGRMASPLASIDVAWHSSRSSIQAVVISNGVVSIGNWAFYYCNSLTSVTIPSGISEIDAGAFAGCNSLMGITVEEPNPYFSSEDGVLYNDDKTTLICFPGGKEMFTIPNTVTEIGEYAFLECRNLTSVTIPGSVTEIGERTFDDCSSLANITVEELNRHFSSEDGVLYNDDKTTLICCPGGKAGSFTIPSSVAEIGRRAFWYCSSLTSVTIPRTVTEIHSSAFSGCSSLTSVTIPDSVTEIVYQTFSGCSSLTSVTIPRTVTAIFWSAFWGCSSLRDVYYAGSETDWAAIDLDYNNDPLISANIHYNSTGPEPEENDTIKYTGISEDGLLVEVEIEPATASDNTVFCAFYAESGQMLSVQSDTPGSELSFAIDTGAVEARIFVLDGESIPQCASVSVSLP